MSKIIFRTVSGNVIGVIEKPDRMDPAKPLQGQFVVKIGVLDRKGDLPREDADTVIANLREFVRTL